MHIYCRVISVFVIKWNSDAGKFEGDWQFILKLHTFETPPPNLQQIKV